MSQLSLLIQQYGVLIVFGTVLLEQFGLPIPAFPVLVVAGALAVDGGGNWQLSLLAVLLACLICDYFWFRAGRYYGKRVLRLLCRISLSPDSCVNQTEDRFRRYGAKSLLVSKFVPGFNTIAAPMSGALGTGTRSFLGFSATGALLWGGSGIAVGAVFHDSVDRVLASLETMGSTALMVLGGLLALFVAYKYVERRRHHAALGIARIGVAELMDLIAAGHDPLIIDARSATAQALDAAIPGALLYKACPPGQWMATLDRERHIVVYCSCPDDVSAAQVAKEFLANGFHRARPLQGGLDAWNAHRQAQGEVRVA
ncbi:sulfurtransferase [Massilia sp. Dwa41.01b]|uniref:DedA family protein/thiosulfate sulfurtransferase GlpE n=1 Tax=unclassified Massilia TaxID=2609279 RepID=UPI0016042A8D|nr:MULTISPECIES: DedA family protein/thiosulfate sulfurtransferase GlpE [unclassified Massilia]QNA88184.1 sulfurtransferase [Massilia sp. Dwa41.01b]QNA99088.1 sulfurtransferase [Massilia sp. Se16.2.3]